MSSLVCTHLVVTSEQNTLGLSNDAQSLSNTHQEFVVNAESLQSVGIGRRGSGASNNYRVMLVSTKVIKTRLVQYSISSYAPCVLRAILHTILSLQTLSGVGSILDGPFVDIHQTTTTADIFEFNCGLTTVPNRRALICANKWYMVRFLQLFANEVNDFAVFFAFGRRRSELVDKSVTSFKRQNLAFTYEVVNNDRC